MIKHHTFPSAGALQPPSVPERRSPEIQPDSPLFIDEALFVRSTVSHLRALWPSVKVRGVALDEGGAAKVRVATPETATPELQNFARTLAIVLGREVSIQNRRAELVRGSPTAIPVELPGALPKPPVDAPLVDLTLKRILSAIDSEKRSEAEEAASVVSGTEAISQQVRSIATHFPIKSVHVSEDNGVVEVSVRDRVASLERDWVPKFLHQLDSRVQKRNPSIRLKVKLRVEEGDLFQVFSEEMHTLRPWSLNYDHDKKRVLAKMPVPEGESLREICPQSMKDRFRALTGYTLHTRAQATAEMSNNIPGTRVVRPMHPSFNLTKLQLQKEFSRLRRVVPDALLPDQIWRLENGNQFYVSYSAKGHSDEFLDLISKNLDDFSVPVVLVPSQNASREVKHEEILNGLRSIAEAYPLVDPEATLTRGRFEISFHNMPGYEQESWFDEFKASVAALQVHSSLPIQLNWSLRDEDLSYLLSEKIGGVAAWSVEASHADRELTIFTEAPRAIDEQELSREMEELTGYSVLVYYGTGLSVGQGDRIDTVAPQAPPSSPLTRKELEELGTVLKDSLPSTLEVEGVEVVGNSLHVKYHRCQLPSAYWSKLKDQFSVFPCPIMFLQRTQQASPLSSEAIEEVIKETVPGGFRLHEITHTDNGPQVSVYGVGMAVQGWGIESYLEGWKFQLQHCFGSAVSVEHIDTPQRFAEELEAADSELSQLLARITEASGQIEELGRIPDAISEVFYPDADKFHLKTPSFAGRKDLTNLAWITLDDHGAQLREDALAYEKLGPGIHMLGISVIDSAAFIEYGGNLDQWARKRGFSHYGDFVRLPLMPDGVSRDGMRFDRGEKRPAISLLVYLNENTGEVEYSLSKSIIRVRSNMSYDRVDRVLSSQRSPTYDYLNGLAGVSRLLSEQSLREGCLETRNLSDARDIVRQSMMLFNETVGGALSASNMPYPGRVSSGPDQAGMGSVLRAAEQYRLPERPTNDPAEVHKLYTELRDKMPAPAYYHLLSSTLPKPSFAMDSDEGSFSRGRKPYALASAPLRSYASLVTHYQLSAMLDGKPGLPPEAVGPIVDELNALEEQLPRKMEPLEKIAGVYRMAKNEGGETRKAIIEEVRADQVSCRVPGYSLDGVLSTDEGVVRRRSIVLPSESGSNGSVTLSAGDELAVEPITYDPVRKRVVLKPA